MDTSRFDWNDLEVFLATARGGSLAAASNVLGVDASTVQRRIGKLEAAMGIRLFERRQRGYSLTSAGEDLLGYTLSMEDQVIAARRRLAALDDSLVGTVRVATVDDLAIHVLSPMLRTFHEAHPRLTVSVEVGTTHADLARQEADVAIRFSHKEPEGDVIAKHIANVGCALYASHGYLAKHGAPISFQDLKQHFIVRGAISQSAMPMERFVDQWFDPERTSFRSESFGARWAAIRDGLGIGFLGYFMGEPDTNLEHLFSVPETASDIYLVVHADMQRSARVRVFVDHVEEGFKALRPIFEGRTRR